MRVIPVLDLQGDLVVLADGRERGHYRPISTPLCNDPDPTEVVAAFLAVHPFREFYLADLDAIERTGSNTECVKRLAHSRPDVEFLLDAGINNASQLAPFKDTANCRFVIGSESLLTMSDYENLKLSTQLDEHILSLDRKNGAELGAPGLIDDAKAWPRTVISMDLAQVGQNKGPGFARLDAIRARRPDVRLIAAGGIRNLEDLIALDEAGVDAALVATALHQKQIIGADLKALEER